MSRTASACGAGRLAVAAVMMSLVAGCGSTGPTPEASSATALPTNSATAQLRREAALQECPQSTGTPSPPASGRRLPAVSLPCLGSDGSVELPSALAGAPAVVNLWASWCRPCYQEMPLLQQVHAGAGSRVRFLGIDLADDPNRALHTVADTGVHYPSIVDRESVVPKALGVQVQPVTLLVRPDGTIAHTIVGPVGSAAALRAAVDRYLGVAL